MAIAYVKNAEVTRTFYNGLGAGFKETFQKRDGTEGAKYYSAFFEEPHGLSEGDTGTVSGLLGTKVNEYEVNGEVRQGVDITLNNARFEADSGGGAESPF